MAKDFFVLGIGGTGMRCLEALVHLCAMGMFDDTTIHMLAVDTDAQNGNFQRLRQLKEAYCNIRKPSDPITRSFFSAQIKYYEYATKYQGAINNFKSIFGHGKDQIASDLADLAFTKEVEEFPLTEGYRARTYLGSMMIYDAIVKAAREHNKPGNTELYKFLEQIDNHMDDQNKPRIFIMGSVFGGTGASAIPVIPQALKQALCQAGFSKDALGECYFGSTLLTAYFTFTKPQDPSKVVAEADKFALNSKIAMMFYNDDKDVRSTYQRFYIMGTEEVGDWKVDDETSVKNEKGKQKATVGGSTQENPSHYIELLAACAARDFCNADIEKLKDAKDRKTPEYLYRSVNADGVLDFCDFVDDQEAKDFAFKFGALIIYSILANKKGYNFSYALAHGDQGNDFISLKGDYDSQVTSLLNYFALFSYDNIGQDQFKDGWVRQLDHSAGEGKFLFNSAMFAPTNQSNMKDCKWNEMLYKKDGLGKEHKFSTGLGFGDRKFDTFKKAVNSELKANPDIIASSTDKMSSVNKLVF